MTQVTDVELVLYYSGNEIYLSDGKLQYIEEILECHLEPPIVVKGSGWVSEGKVDIREEVYHFKDDNTYYKLIQARDGDYFSDYEYYEPEIYEVVPQEVTTITYKKKC